MIAHLGFIAFAYGFSIVVIGGMIGAVVYEHRRLRRELSRFEDRD
jgi:heme exporter protein CcmD